MGRSRYHHYHRRSWARRRVGPLLVLLCAVVLAGAGVVTVALFALMAIFGQFLLVGAGSVVVVRHLHRRHRHRRAMGPTQPAAVSPAARAAPVPDWRAARARFVQLRSEYGQFECDPLAVLRLPALTDVTVASTGRFVDAFAEAQALDTDTEPPAAHCARFVTAVNQAWRAWGAARDAAERIRLAGIPAQERATVARAIKLLTMARDSDHDAERTAAYAKARAELAKLDRSGTLRLPPTAAAALDAAARSQLPAG
ncbi:MAG: hypothetical protein DLM62_03400 [Pseudonocardiales bacterium]|nr:MAG: hypothetical protein DLM62_03400 [Pseudonocardiales bacterium]